MEPERVTAFNHPAANPREWLLEPRVTFLNHGSFGACPKAVLEHQRLLRERLEREPVQFLVRDLEGLVDEARRALGKFLGASGDDLAFIPNATTGLNAVLRSLEFKRGDELLVTNHEYNASRNALNFVAERSGAKVVQAEIPFPVQFGGEIEQAILGRVTSRTRLVMLDHVTSQTGLVLPIGPIIRELEARGVRVLVDGAHAPGMIPLNLAKLGASYYTGNCHKWICAPKGAAFLHVRRDRQKEIRPLVISHGANSPRKDRSRFLIEFGWMGTSDPTAALSVPAALQFMGGLMPGGWRELMERNRQLAIAGREILCEALGMDKPCPDTMLGSLASIRIADSRTVKVPKSPLYLDELQEELFAKHRIEVPIIPWPAPPKRLLRISAAAYNRLSEYEKLAEAVRGLLS